MRAFAGYLIGIMILWGGVQLAMLAWADYWAAHEFQGIPFTRLLAADYAHFSPYGCSYTVVELPEGAGMYPPPLSDLSAAHAWAVERQLHWRLTPLTATNEIEALVGCLIGDSQGTDRNGFFTGFGLGGYGEAAFDALTRSGSWALVENASAEQQRMLLYAPRDRLALYVRWGD